MAKWTKKEQEDAQARLRAMLPPGTELKTILRHVSKSEMSRDISVIHNGESITYLVAQALGESLRESMGHHAIRVGGCGMDMGFELVYRLGRRLYPGGFKPRDAGRSYGRNGTSADAIDEDGGYALTQRWL